ncbi:MAG: hypothetical protein AAGF35_15670 [Pseudomonadota bacterium]
MSAITHKNQYQFLLWAREGVAAQALHTAMMDALQEYATGGDSISRLRLAVADNDVAPAAARRIESHAPLPDGLLSVTVADQSELTWLDSLLAEHTARYAGYRVAVREPLDGQQQHPCKPGERMFGLCQVALLCRPAALKVSDWQSIWQDSHTQIAIETQSTFGYRQNRVLQTLNSAAPAIDAVVEEYFPLEAMTSDHAFYGTGGDDELLATRMTRLLESCARFIDFEHIDVIPMSEYRIV